MTDQSTDRPTDRTGRRDSKRKKKSKSLHKKENYYLRFKIKKKLTWQVFSSRLIWVAQGTYWQRERL